MILVVTLNPAIDVTHHVDGADWAGVNRPHAVTARPGGKGVNVARVLHDLGTEVLVTGLAGGPAGDALGGGLRQAGIAAEFSAVAGETRRTFAVADTRRGQTGLFNEPGPAVSAGELAAFRRRYAASLPGSAAVVLSGSLPPGVPADVYADLAALAAAAGVPVILDTDGPALRAGVAGQPSIVKPNLPELERVAGRTLTGSTGGAGSGLDAVLAAAADLVAGGAGAVVVSLGADGLAAVTGEGRWRAAAPAQAAVNATGAGDAVVAGLARGLELGQGWAERLRHAAALGTAAALAPAAGEVDGPLYEGLLAEVRVERLADPADGCQARRAVGK